MTETMWKVLDILRQRYLVIGAEGSYLTAWHLEEILNIPLAGCGMPDGDPAIEKLIEMGIIEELPDLGCRVRIVVKDGE